MAALAKKPKSSESLANSKEKEFLFMALDAN